MVIILVLHFSLTKQKNRRGKIPVAGKKLFLSLRIVLSRGGALRGSSADGFSHP